MCTVWRLKSSWESLFVSLMSSKKVFAKEKHLENVSRVFVPLKSELFPSRKLHYPQKPQREISEIFLSRGKWFSFVFLHEQNLKRNSRFSRYHNHDIPFSNRAIFYRQRIFQRLKDRKLCHGNWAFIQHLRDKFNFYKRKRSFDFKRERENS